jgi:hypothetical protein
LFDFGLAHIIPEGKEIALMSGKCGTRGYIAPEISRHEDDFES